MASSSVRSLIQDPNDNTTLRDYRHASKVFVTNSFRLAPKSKFNFFAHFVLNSSVLTADFLNKHTSEINVLLKSINMPKFEIKTETLNQYNRKKVVPVTTSYRPITLEFHDDNFGVSRMLWENFYHYHVGDPSRAKHPEKYYTRSAMKNFDENDNGKYGLDTGNYKQFFKKIVIYHMGVNVSMDGDTAIHGWNSYTIVNPMIVEWSHDDLDHSAGSQLSSHKITMHYEAVAYDTGEITPDNPPIFSDSQYYFNEHSPLIKK